jgi:tRNA pseudouridine32 synthase/23S rRNA pseudouridine746 synthase
VHLKAIGHPILGDALYAPAAEAAMAQRMQLHACNLAFPHPITGALIHFECGADF